MAANITSELDKALGTPVTQTKKPPRKTTFRSETCGDLTIRFGSVEWYDNETGGFQPPEPEFYAKVRGYKNSRGYDAEVPLSGDPKELRALASALIDVANFIESTRVDISRNTSVNDIDAAKAMFGKKN